MSDKKPMHPIDQDTLQLIYENDKEWAKAWKKAVLETNQKQEKTVKRIRIKAIPTIKSS